ncbi:alpha/beta fold hydrolase [Gayadomonas joobiniege]|uniref:alpha/beta fold hydrolase n=1 Tax=Gayadomonas joobiniege TaxID=1234606 RepID=UPI00036C8C70|nr:alpha/beta hydrolase [Gayadomonas joobiniege]
MPAFVERFYLLPDGRTIACQQKQSSKNRSWFVGLHGWLDNSNSLIPLTQQFSGYNCLLPDLSGHGLSSHRSKDSFYHAIDWVYDLHQLLKILKIDNLVLCGHSLGGMLAALYAGIFPTQVSQLILLDSAAGFTLPTTDFVKNLQTSFLSRDKFSGRESVKWRPLKLLPKLYQTRAIHSQLTIAQAEFLLQRNLLIKEDCFSWRSDAKLQAVSPLRLTDEQVEELIRSLSMPVHIILAQNGLADIAAAVHQRLNYFKQAKCYKLPGGHHFHLQNPVDCATLLKKIM